jgi:peptidoglycan/LPS O-acetylase OafA/YrhL
MADHHSWDWLSGGLGVNVFFVLSGYLITTLAVREERQTGRLHLGAFFLRRTCRIFPLYYLALILYTVLILWTSWSSTLRGNFLKAWPAYLLYCQEFPFAWDVIGSGLQSPFAHSWSLGIEEKFYIVWPVIGFVVLRQQTRMRLTFTVCTMLLLASTQSLHRVSPAASQWSLQFLLFPYSQILCGSVLALLLDREKWFRGLQWLGTRWGTALSLTCLLAIQLLTAQVKSTLPEIVILHTLAAALVIASLVLGRSRLIRLFSSRVLTSLGRWSYGIYLFHPLGISFAQKWIRPGSDRWEVAILAYLLAVLATSGLAALLYRCVEQPGIQLARSRQHRIAMTAA